ncbi:hypothetical protein [Roseimarinus sediminis]|jgi:hypothetical protein|uniref:hypothetical protein n=1 Tax=Roseimarinus sediminis TaxID=1610899 RepID=UPI003D22A744
MKHLIFLFILFALLAEARAQDFLSYGAYSAGQLSSFKNEAGIGIGYVLKQNEQKMTRLRLQNMYWRSTSERISNNVLISTREIPVQFTLMHDWLFTIKTSGSHHVSLGPGVGMYAYKIFYRENEGPLRSYAMNLFSVLALTANYEYRFERMHFFASLSPELSHTFFPFESLSIGGSNTLQGSLNFNIGVRYSLFNKRKE